MTTAGRNSGGGQGRSGDGRRGAGRGAAKKSAARQGRPAPAKKSTARRGVTPQKGAVRKATAKKAVGQRKSAQGKPSQHMASSRFYEARFTAARPNRPAQSRPWDEADVIENHPSHSDTGDRLQKVLSAAGVASRRVSEELIAQGRVEVDGVIVREPGLRIDPTTAVVYVDGVRLQLDTSRLYLALNKPRGVVSAMSDPEGRPCLGDLVSQRSERLFHVGRLDVDTEGLILLTNDGELSHRLQHPSHGVPKTYLAEVAGVLQRGVSRQLRDGVDLEDGLARADSFTVIDQRPGRTLVELIIHEGRNHIVRRMMAAVGHPVLQLVRTQVGPVTLGDLKPGKMRPLRRAELSDLLRTVDM